MTSFTLAEITTEDGLVHQGVFSNPTTTNNTALVWIHGLTSTFYSHIELLEATASAGEKLGYGLASFNNRGHDAITSIHQVDPTNPKGYSRFPAGAGQEVFEESVFDIAAVVAFLENQGFTKIILIGHSTGANKVCYYLATKKPAAVLGAILVSPLSDRLVPGDHNNQIQSALQKMNKLIEQGQGDILTTEHFYYPITPRRFKSLFDPSSVEDMFDYGEETPRMRFFSELTLPLLLIHGSLDEHADRPIEEIQKVFAEKSTSSAYKNLIIPEAFHSFGAKEAILTEAIMGWIQELPQ